MKRLIVLLITLAFLASACVTTTPSNAPYQGAAVGAAVGSAVGAAVDRDNRWRGAVIGGTAGAVLGGALTEINQRAVQSRQPTVTVTPSTGETRCHKVHRRVIENGRVVKDVVEEVCEGQRYVPAY